MPFDTEPKTTSNTDIAISPTDYLRDSIMPEPGINGLAHSIYVLGPDYKGEDWYPANMPCSNTSMKVYSAALNLTSSDFQKLREEISALVFDQHGMKSDQNKQRFQKWASDFCDTRFNTAGLYEHRKKWLIQAIIWLKHTDNRYRKRRMGIGSRAPLLTSSEAEGNRPQVMWVAATPNTLGDPIEKNLVIRFLKTTNKLEEELPWFNVADLKNSKTSLGPAFLNSIEPTQQPDIHQGLVLMQIVKHLYEAKVSIHPWKGFFGDFVQPEESQTMKSMLLDNKKFIRSTVIVLYCDTALCVESGMDLLYTRIERLQTYYGACLRAFPSRSEALQARTKIRDLRALDELARTSGFWRPVTCYPVTTCSLEDAETTVHKRQESSGGDYVQIKHTGDNGELTCAKKGIPERKKRKRHIEAAKAEPLWFHQELVPTFADWGEFRVFIVTKPEPHSRRGLGGMIVAVAHTVNSTTNNDTMYVERATNATFTRINCGLCLDDLKHFAMNTFNSLRARHDWEKSFESLEVGVRLDIAITPNIPRSFFVNEITRWYEAAFFSDDIMAEPKYTLCEEFAKAFTAYLSKLSVT